MKNNLKKLNDKITLFHWLFLFLAGFLAGFFSLILSILINSIFQNFSFWQNIILISIVILVLIEELIKLFSINFFIVKKSLINISNILMGLFFGFGFGFFEFILIIFKITPEAPELFSILALFSVHLLTSIILISTVFYLKKNLWFALFYFFLAFTIHLVYNSFIYIYIF